MNRRGLDRLDYKVLHETGRKVRKGGENLTLNEDTEELNSKLQNLTLKMDVNREITDELKIREDIKHALNLYILDDSLIDEEIRESMSVISELSRNFRHIHVELKQKMDVNEYNEKYPEYETILGRMTDFIKGAKFNLRAVREQNVRLEAENARVLEREEQTRQKMTSLKIKEEFLEVKIDQVENMFDLNTVENTDEIDDYVTKIDGYINEYFNLYSSLKLCVGDDFEEYRPKFENVTRTLRTSVDRAKIAKRNILSKNQETKQRDAKTAAVSKQIICAENLYSEIDFRCNSFTKKYEVDFDKMSDYQILELVKDKNLDFELNSIVDKITQLALLVPVGGDQVQILLERAKHLRSDVSKIKETFLSELQMNVLERDISESKMKNVSSLKIELPKFSGYNSKMDVFTFKSKFQKLVEPTVQKKYWAEYLKRNYLKEPALTLVESESDYSKLWGKLLESFGNSRLLLQNKLSYLDKIGGLWKVKGDENISVALASLINSMNDLSSLASEHNIEGQLYEGGGLEKIMFLIGSHRHRKFREENLSSQLSKKEEWDKLLELLKHEQILREKLTLDSKTAKVMGFDLDGRGDQNSHPKGDEKSGECTSDSSSHTETLKCHICDKIDHTVVTTAGGNKVVPYYVCEKFVNMSPGERFQNLKNKNLCVGCLLPGAVKESKHKCFFQNFCCPHASHDKNNKIHVVLCDQHQKDTDNINLLNKFKDKFINNSKVELPEYCKHLYCSSEIEVTSETLKVHSLGHTTESDTQDSGIFQLQTIEIEGINLNLFFDSGCGDMVAKKSAIEKLCGIGRAKQIMPGPLTVSGVGDQKSVCHDGVYNIQLPLIEGGEANISGICMPKVTTDFPVYPLRKVEAFLRKECNIRGGTSLVQKLPKLPEMVGGDTDILIGIKYAKYYPKLIFELDSGLRIYGSVFLSSDGARGVESGPHAESSKAEKA